MKKHNFLIKTSAVILGSMYCVNKYIETDINLDENTRVSGKYYHWKYGSVFYKVIGNGSPLLLIHDLTVFSSGYEWSQIADTLAKDHTVYMIDLIGCGRSDKPQILYTGYFYIQLLRDFIHDVIGEKTNVIASGLSSSIVLMANVSDKALFGDITLINPKNPRPKNGTSDLCSKLTVKLFQLPIVGKSLYYASTSMGNTDYYLTETCFYSPFRLKPAVTKAYYHAAHISNGDGKMLFASLKSGYLNTDISRFVAQTQNRLIIITGDKIDRQKEIESAYLKLNRNTIALSIPKTKYLPHLEAPEKILEYL